MKTASKLVAAATFALVLTSCSGGQRGPRFKPGVINRVLATAPGEAQPSDIVAAEVAYSQDAKSNGFFAASAKLATSAAKVHGTGGITAFPSGASKGELYGAPAEWGPRTVVMSCNGALALSAGRYRNADGLIGTYITTWERQKDNSYKWSYNAAGIDDPQPPPRPEFEDSLIVVTAIDSIYGLVATCPSAGTPIPPPPAVSLANDYPGEAQLSKDGTLRWRWEHRPDGKKYVLAEYYYEGGWETAFEEELASTAQE